MDAAEREFGVAKQIDADWDTERLRLYLCVYHLVEIGKERKIPSVKDLTDLLSFSSSST